MASTVYGYGRTVTSCDGLEVDPSATGPSAPGLHQLPESQGIEATPGELGPSPGPQTLPIPQKELALDRATTAQFQLASSSDLKIPSGSRSSPKSKRLLPLVMAVIIVAVIVLALAIPLAVRLKKPSKPYVRTATLVDTANCSNIFIGALRSIQILPLGSRLNYLPPKLSMELLSRLQAWILRVYLISVFSIKTTIPQFTDYTALSSHHSQVASPSLPQMQEMPHR